MVRPKSRKTIEDLYAVAPPPPPSLVTTRFDENFYQNSKNPKCTKYNMEKSDLCNKNTTACRKNRKGSNVEEGSEKKDEKTCTNEENLFGKKEKSKKIELLASSTLDNKNLMSYVSTENEKDEDTEEFFGLIKETVEHAVAKTASDIFSRSFREICSKIEDLRNQLEANEAKLDKIQADMNNKIVHYGEENSRHFRYLCMKSEYDKMFYQHQNVMTAMPVDSRPNLMNPGPQQFAPPGPGSATGHIQESSTRPIPPQQNASNRCNCDKQACGDIGDVERSKTSMSTKSSQMGVKKVEDLLEQLQKFYEQQQSEDAIRKDVRTNKLRDVNLNIQDDSGDGDDDDDSFDDQTSPSVKEDLLGGGDA